MFELVHPLIPEEFTYIKEELGSDVDLTSAKALEFARARPDGFRILQLDDGWKNYVHIMENSEIVIDRVGYALEILKSSDRTFDAIQAILEFELPLTKGELNWQRLIDGFANGELTVVNGEIHQK